VAELFFGVMLSLLRNLPDAVQSMREGRWDRAALMGGELHGRTLGIVGLGRIGGEVAHRAHAFGMQVVAYDPYVADARFAARHARRAETLDALLDEPTWSPCTRRSPTRRAACSGGASWRACAPARSSPTSPAAASSTTRRCSPRSRRAAARRGARRVRGRAARRGPPAAPRAERHPHAPRRAPTPPRRSATSPWTCAPRCATRCSPASCRASLNVAAVDGAWRELQPAMLVARRAAAVARAILADMGVRAVQRLTLRCGQRARRRARGAAQRRGARRVEGQLEADRLNLINARAIAEGQRARARRRARARSCRPTASRCRCAPRCRS
jgi:D-3-phosphoglycerate dehydrogenase